MKAFIFLFALLIAQYDDVANAQDELTLKVVMLDEVKSGSRSRIWLQITNVGTSARILCRESRGIRYTSTDPKEIIWSDSGASIHGCGDEDHDPTWLLLPGESRFDSVELEGAITAAGRLFVNEVLLDKSASTSTYSRSDTSRHPLSWSGEVREAIAGGEAIRSFRRQ